MGRLKLASRFKQMIERAERHRHNSVVQTVAEQTQILHDEHNDVSNNLDVSNPNTTGSDEWNATDFDRVPLDSLLLTINRTSPQILAEQKNLKSSLEHLKGELARWNPTFIDHDPFSNKNLPISAELIMGIISSKEKKGGTKWERIKKRLKQAIPYAVVAASAVSIAGEATAIAPVKIAANAVTIVLTVAKDVGELSDKIPSFLKETLSSWRFLTVLDMVNGDLISELLLVEAIKLSNAVTHLLRATLVFMRGNLFKKVEQVMNPESDLKEAETNLHSALKHFGNAVQTEALRIQIDREENDQVGSIMTSHFPDEDNEAAAYHRDIANRRMKNSGEWILNNRAMKEWFDDRIPRLWFCGHAGAGKTFLSSKIIDECLSKYQDRKGVIGVAWIYCQNSRQNTQTVKYLVKSLIRQVCDSPYGLRTGFTRKRCNKMIRDFGQNCYNATLDNYLGFLGDLTKEYQRLVVVIDGFDECSEVDSDGINRDYLVKRLLLMGVRLLLTSRKLESLKNLCSDWESIEISPDSDEVQRFIRWRIDDENQTTTEFRETLEANNGLRELIQGEIYNRYSEVFDLVRVQTEVILTLKTVGDIKEQLSKFPTERSTVYSQTIDRIILLSPRDPSSSKLGLRAIQWVFGVKKPLYLEQLQEALAFKLFGDYAGNNRPADFREFIPMAKHITDWSLGLVVLLPESGMFAFSHPTVKEYLETRNDDLFGSDLHMMISKDSLDYLSFQATLSSPPSPRDPGLFGFASNNWYEYIENEDVGERLREKWTPILDPSATSDYRRWQLVHSKKLGISRKSRDFTDVVPPKSAFEIACRIHIRWLLMLLSLELVKESLASLEGNMIFVGRHWPHMLPTILEIYLSENSRLSEKLLVAIAAAGDYEVGRMKRIFEQNQHLNVTSSMLLEAARSDLPKNMLEYLCLQYERLRETHELEETQERPLPQYDRYILGLPLGPKQHQLVVVVVFSIVAFTAYQLPVAANGILALIGLWYIRNYPSIHGFPETDNPNLETLVPISRNRVASTETLDAEILIAAANNVRLPTEDVLYLRNHLQVPVTVDALYAILPRSWQIVREWSLQGGIELSAAKCMQKILATYKSVYCYPIYHCSGRHYSNLLDLLENIEEYARIELNPELIHTIELTKILSKSRVRFDPVLLVNSKRTAKITQEGVQCMVKHNPRLTESCFHLHSMDVSIAYALLIELHNHLDENYNPNEDGENPCSIARQNLRVLLEQEGYPMWFSYRSKIIDSSFRNNVGVTSTRSRLVNIIDYLVRSLPETSGAVDQALRSDSASITEAVLKVRYWQQYHGDGIEHQADPSLDTLDTMMLDALTEKLVPSNIKDQSSIRDEDVFVVSITRHIEPNILRRALSTARDVFDQLHQATIQLGGDSLFAAIAYISFKYLLLQNEHRRDTLKELYRLVVHVFYQYPDPTTRPSCFMFPENLLDDLYTTALSGSDIGLASGLENILTHYRGWKPNPDHFNIAARSRLGYEGFKVLQNHNKRVGTDQSGAQMTSWDTTVLFHAVQNTCDSCLALVAFILEEKEDDYDFDAKRAIPFAKKNRLYGEDLEPMLEHWSNDQAIKRTKDTDSLAYDDSDYESGKFDWEESDEEV